MDSKLKAFLNSIDNGEAVSACVYHLLDTYYQCHNLFAVDVVAHLHLTTNMKPRRLFSAVSVPSFCRTVFLQPLVFRFQNAEESATGPAEKTANCVGSFRLISRIFDANIIKAREKPESLGEKHLKRHGKCCLIYELTATYQCVILTNELWNMHERREIWVSKIDFLCNISQLGMYFGSSPA